MSKFTVSPAEIKAIDAALDKAVTLGVAVRKDAGDVAHELLELSREDGCWAEKVEIGSIGWRPWYVGLTRDHTEPGSPLVAYLLQDGRGGYAETFPVEEVAR